LIIAPGAHLLFSATSFSESAAVSGTVPEGERLAALCSHLNHGAECIMLCSAGVVAVGPTLTVAPLREPPRADVAAAPILRHSLAANARGPPSA
jgi:hypothetical protein